MSIEALEPTRIRSNSLKDNAIVEPKRIKLLRSHSDPITQRKSSDSTNGPQLLRSLSYQERPTQILFRSFSFTGAESSVGNYSSFRAKKTFYCQICLENVDKDGAYIPTNCTMSHEFCRDCMVAYTSHEITEGNVDSMACPLISSSQCNGQLEDYEVESLVDGSLYERYTALKEKRRDPNNRECPQCDKIILGSPHNPKMHCIDCDVNFCFFHSNAHPNESCEAYIVRTRAGERLNKKYLQAHSRPCPSCGLMTEKSGGCNHMTCHVCHGQWCWLCGREYEPDHYDITNYLGCPGAQFAPSSPLSCWSCRLSRISPTMAWFINCIRNCPLFILGFSEAIIVFVAILVSIFATAGIVVIMAPLIFLIGCFCCRTIRVKSKYHRCYLKPTPSERHCRCDICEIKKGELHEDGDSLVNDNRVVYTCEECDFDICNECFSDDAPEVGTGGNNGCEGSTCSEKNHDALVTIEDLEIGAGENNGYESSTFLEENHDALVDIDDLRAKNRQRVWQRGVPNEVVGNNEEETTKVDMGLIFSFCATYCSFFLSVVLIGVIMLAISIAWLPLGILVVLPHIVQTGYVVCVAGAGEFEENIYEDLQQALKTNFLYPLFVLSLVTEGMEDLLSTRR